jgi:hypothetical protein
LAPVNVSNLKSDRLHRASPPLVDRGPYVPLRQAVRVSQARYRRLKSSPPLTALIYHHIPKAIAAENVR